MRFTQHSVNECDFAVISARRTLFRLTSEVFQFHGTPHLIYEISSYPTNTSRLISVAPVGTGSFVGTVLI